MSLFGFVDNGGRKRFCALRVVNFHRYTASTIQLVLGSIHHKLCNTVAVISRVPHNRLRVEFLSGRVIMVMSPGFAMILSVLRTMFVSINFNFIMLSARVLLLIFIICASPSACVHPSGKKTTMNILPTLTNR